MATKYPFQKLVDIPRLRSLFEEFSRSTGFTTGLVSYPEQELLIATGWRDICVKFHRACPKAAECCKESNSHLTACLKELKELNIKPCDNGLVDGATPVIIRGMHLASLATGQVLLAPPDIAFHRELAKKYGYDEEAYLVALAKVPVVTEEQLTGALKFLSGLAVQMGEEGLRTLQLQETAKALQEENAQRKRMEDQHQILHNAIESSIGAVALADMGGKVTYVNPACIRIWGYNDKEEMIGRSALEFWADPENARRIISEVSQGKTESSDRSGKRKDGTVFDVHISVSLVRDESEIPLCLMVSAADITERKKAETALKESEEMFRTLTNNLPVLVARFDRDLRHLYVNQPVEKLLHKSKQMFIGKTNRELGMTEEQLALWDPAVRQVFDTGCEVRFQFRVETETGLYFWDTHMAPEFAADGSVETVLAITHNINDLLSKEEKLRESEQLFRTLFNAITDSVFVNNIDKDGSFGTFQEVNDVACQRLGYSREELRKLTPNNIDVPENRIAADSPIIRKLKAGEDVTFEQVHVAKDGHHIPVEIHAQPFIFHGQHAVIALVRDITVRKKVVLALEHSEKKARHLNELLQAMYDIQHIIRNEQVVEKLLEGICHILVEKRNYLATWIGVPNPDTKQVTAVAYAGRSDKILQKAPITWDDTPNGRGPCGTAIRERVPVVFSDIATDPLFEPWRKAAIAAGCGSIASFPIITKKHLWGVITIKANRPNAFSEEEIELLTDLAHEVAQALQSIENRVEWERMEEIARQERKMAAVGQLAGGIAHDFNNILGACMLQIGIMKERTDLTSDLRQGLEEIEQGAFRAANLTRQLLMFSRKQAVQIKTLDMRAILDSVLGMLSRILGESIDLKVQTDEKPMWIKADQGMIEQVIVNLCVNARDAMCDGGKLTLRVEEMEVQDTPDHPNAHPGKFVCLSVADTGTGIAPEDLKHIFEPFFTTKEVGKGTGLGLATVYGIIQQHEGWIEVESKVGKGTLFRIFLPLLDGGQTAAGVEDSKMPRGRETIFVVEDNVVLLRSIISGLQKLGYRVMEAANGADALKKWEKNSNIIDLLITDMVMPGGMTGLELVQQIQSQSPGFKAIISSGYSNELNALSQALCSNIILLPKPYSISVMANTIRQCLDSNSAS